MIDAFLWPVIGHKFLFLCVLPYAIQGVETEGVED